MMGGIPRKGGALDAYCSLLISTKEVLSPRELEFILSCLLPVSCLIPHHLLTYFFSTLSSPSITNFHWKNATKTS
jgi:hypothetical protein